MDARVTIEMNNMLLFDFSELEVKEAIFQMPPLSSPGPIGFLSQFYQTQLEDVGKEVCRFVLNFLKGGGSLRSINDTFITFIPKVKELKQVTEHRLISLCNILYKIVAKVLANRLKQILPMIISPTHSAFILGRLITNNILVNYETLHSLNTSKSGKEYYMHQVGYEQTI